MLKIGMAGLAGLGAAVAAGAWGHFTPWNCVFTGIAVAAVGVFAGK